MDLDCGNFLQLNLPNVCFCSSLPSVLNTYDYFQAVASGKVTSAVVDTAVSHLLADQIRAGIFDPPSIQPYLKIGIDQISTPAAQATALRGAQEGLVLLKNVNEVLPLKPDQSATV